MRLRFLYLGMIGILLCWPISGCVSGRGKEGKVSSLESKMVSSVVASERKKEAGQYEDMLCLSCRGKFLSSDLSNLIRVFLWKQMQIVVFCGSSGVDIDGKYVSLPKKTVCKANQVMVSSAIENYIRNIKWMGRQIKVMIDPGHGGKDPGAVSSGVKEKDIVLDVARRLYLYLKSYGMDVRMTRKDDRFISLKNRAEKTNKYMPDVFVSIHANSSPRMSGCGIEVYYVSEKVDDISRAVVASENSVLQGGNYGRDHSVEVIVWDMIYTGNRHKSRKLAKIVAENISRVMNSPNRGAKGGPFYVLKWVNVPAILVEIGFLSNPTERKKLLSSSYRDKIARAIAEGIREYIRKLNKGQI